MAALGGRRLRAPGPGGQPTSRRPARSSPRSRSAATAAAAGSRTIPSSHDFNKDLYCSRRARALRRPDGLQRRFRRRCPWWPRRSSATRTARCGRSLSARTSRWSDNSPVHARRTSSGRGSASSIRPRSALRLASSTTSRTARPFNKKQVTDAIQVGVRAKDDWTLEVTLEGPARLLPGARRLSGRAAGPPAARSRSTATSGRRPATSSATGRSRSRRGSTTSRSCSRRTRTTSAPRTCT